MVDRARLHHPDQAHDEAAMKEKAIEVEIRLALEKGGLMLMKHRVELCPYCGGRPKRGQGLGLGCADLIGVVSPYGRFLAIEVKVPKRKNAKRDDHQRRWMEVVRRYGGIAGVATSVAEAWELVRLARSST